MYFAVALLQYKGVVELPWRRGGVVNVSANGTEDHGFESRQGVKF
jgi:hypothetical protein